MKKKLERKQPIPHRISYDKHTPAPTRARETWRPARLRVRALAAHGRRRPTSAITLSVGLGSTSSGSTSPEGQGIDRLGRPLFGLTPVRRLSRLAMRACWQHSARGKAASADTVHSLLGSTPAGEIAVLTPGKFGKLCVFADIKFLIAIFFYLMLCFLRYLHVRVLDQYGMKCKDRLSIIIK